MRQTIACEMDDGTTVVIEADGRDVRAWEAAYDASWFITPMSFTTVAQVAYLAGKRTGALNGSYPSYEEFDAHCVDARGRPAPVVARPTKAARTAASSSPSPTASASSRRNSNARGRK